MNRLKFPINAKRIFKHSYFTKNYEKIDHKDAINQSFDASVKNIHNEINDKIGNKTILHKYEIKDSCKEVINILFSSEFEPPVNTFKHIVITYLGNQRFM
jgi:hypothetical protein